MTLCELMREKGANTVLAINYLKIPVYALDNNELGAHEFNQYYSEMLMKKGWHNIVRTKSGGISITRKNLKLPMWDLKYSNAVIEITIIDTKMLRIQFRQTSSVLAEEGTQQIYGRQAFATFRKELAKDGIMLDSYKIDNGPEVKKTIPKYIIKMERESFVDMEFSNCHHIDFHNSFPAGLVNTHPEFYTTINRLYEKRKTNPVYKAVLNYAIGFCQSIDGCQARYAGLSKDAIADNNKRVMELAAKVAKAGRMIISYNTDGFWYCGDVYHGEGEGKKLGEWENDHTNCRFRAKSAGAYEFIEDGKYMPVVRGRTNLDLIKPRENWEWGDIYKKEARVVLFYWKDGVGITNENNELL